MKDHPEALSGAQREALHLPGIKYFPLEAMYAGEGAFIYGAKKYGDRNWEKGLPIQQLIDSCQRHLDAIKARRRRDEGDSELLHTWLFMASAAMLVTSLARGISEDDRLPEPYPSAFTSKQLAKDVAQELGRAKKAQNPIHTIPYKVSETTEYAAVDSLNELRERVRDAKINPSEIEDDPTSIRHTHGPAD